MAKLLLEIRGTIESGFYVSLGVSATPGMGQQVQGRLPAANRVIAAYTKWQSMYAQLDQAYRIEEVEVTTQVSLITLRSETETVVQELNEWLKAPELESVRTQLKVHLAFAKKHQEEVQILLQTNDPKLRQLPWQLWDLVEDYDQAEIALSTPNYEESVNPVAKRGRLKILVILGNSAGINTESDRQEFENLPGKPYICFLDQPSRQEFHDALWEQRWDVLFFAGHSRTVEQKGWIDINPHDSVRIDELRQGLRIAIQRGLQLAIFNSCNGLGLVQPLEKLNIPHLIVMREPVPDLVAQEFLKYFLQAFSQDNNFFSAVKHARNRLERLQAQFPGATWLPVIYQHPHAEPLTWQKLSRRAKKTSRSIRWRSLVAISLGVTGVIMGVRSQGWLQPSELKAFDHLMQQRPIEGPDDRFLVVGLTQVDVDQQTRNSEPGAGSLSDKALQTLIEKLEKHQPRVIGLDIVRDQPVTATYKSSLGKRLASHQKPPLIFICSTKDKYEPNGVSQPPEVAITQTGFSDVPQDRDSITRLSLLTLPPEPSPCQASVAFGLQLALQYLESEGVALSFTSEEFIKLGEAVFRPLGKHAGGYQNDPDVDSQYDQVLINYRPYRNLSDIASAVTLQDVLNDRVPANQIRNKIVIVGRVDTDLWATPYPAWEISGGLTPGAYIHAQATSQILSAVLNRRPLLSWWPVWADWGWVAGWGVIGAVLAYLVERLPFKNRRWALAGLTGSVALVIYLSCWLGMLQALWLPLIPAILALGLSSFSTLIYSKIISQGNNR